MHIAGLSLRSVCLKLLPAQLGRRPDSVLSWDLSYTTTHLLLSCPYCLLSDPVCAAKFIQVQSPERLFQHERFRNQNMLLLGTFSKPREGTQNLTNQKVLWGNIKMACFTSGLLGFLDMWLSHSGQVECAVWKGRERRGEKRERPPKRWIDRKGTADIKWGESLPRYLGLYVESNNVLICSATSESDQKKKWFPQWGCYWIIWSPVVTLRNGRK